jgi:two-component system OmpR family response regulator
MEFRILDAMVGQAGRVLSRDELLAVAAPEAEVFDRTLDRHITNIRRKIERDPACPELIHTVVGIGYRFSEH